MDRLTETTQLVVQSRFVRFLNRLTGALKLTLSLSGTLLQLKKFCGERRGTGMGEGVETRLCLTSDVKLNELYDRLVEMFEN